MKKLIVVHILVLFTFMLAACIDLSTGSADSVQSSNNINNTESNTTSGQPQNDRFLEGLVERSDLIFYGTLKGISNEMSIENIPYTFLTYDIHKIIAGHYKGQSLTLRFVGGNYPDGRTLSASNSPEVRLGEKGIAMVQKGLDTGCDFVDCKEGRFLIEDGKIIAANKAAISIDDQDRVTYISARAQKTGEYKGLLDNMTVERFVHYLEDLDAKTAGHRKGQRNVVTDAYNDMPFHAYKGLTQASPGPTVSKSLAKGTPDVVQGSPYDQWEVQQLKENGGNPVLKQTYNGSH